MLNSEIILSKFLNYRKQNAFVVGINEYTKPGKV